MKKLCKICLVLIMALLLCIGGPTAKDISAATVTFDTDTSGVTSERSYIALKGKYLVDTANALKRINEIRYEACKEGVRNPNTNNPLTLSDYAPLKWSADLEAIARIRAAEGCVTMAHQRTTGASCFDLSHNGVSSYGECLAWNWTDQVIPGIEQWYREKEYWVDQTPGKVTGHYTMMINPSYTYVGLGCFYSDDGFYPNTLAGEFTYGSGRDETQANGSSDCKQLLEIRNASVTGVKVASLPDMTVGQTKKISAKVTSSDIEGLELPLEAASWTSSNTNVATVDSYGNVKAKACGKASITCSLGGNSITVNVPHNYSQSSIIKTASTQQEGVITDTCSVCGSTRNRAIKKPASIVLGTSTYTYSGTAYKPSVKVKDEAGNVISTSNYTVTYANNTKAGTATAKVTFNNQRYSGTMTKTFTINKKSLSGSVVKLSGTTYVYNAQARKPIVTITLGGKTLVNGTDYAVTYANNIRVGKATVTITGKNNYSGKMTKTFTIKPKATTLGTLTPYTKAFTAKWTKVTAQTTGYQLQYSTSSTFASGNKTVTITSNTTGSKKVGSLTAKKTYYVRIRTYKTVGDTKYYSAWSAKKSVKTK